MTATASAILIAAAPLAVPVRELVDRLASIGVATAIVEELPAAVRLVTQAAVPPCVLLDLTAAGTDEVEELRAAADAIQRIVTALPLVMPIPIVIEAPAAMVIACLRAGAGDVIDLRLEGTASARAAIQRICRRQATRATEVEMLVSQRAMIEELLRDLIRTERRSLQTEEQLAAATRPEVTAVADARPPAILLVEHDRDIADDLADRLEEAGITTYAFVTGEEALREAAALAASDGLDLALIAAQLPTIDGLATIRGLRDLIGGLPAFLMTSVDDGELAAHAANLGVVGFVHKPLEDVEEVVSRLSQLAHESLQRTREQAYLHRIKERHERVLARYRSLPRGP